MAGAPSSTRSREPAGTIRLRLWLAVFPLLIAAAEAAHGLLDSFAPRTYLGAELFEGHSVTAALRLPLAGLAIGLAAAAAAAWAVSGGRGRTRSAGISARVVALTPLVLFAVQEHVEYALGHGHVSVLVARPAFLAGLALQAPFAVLAWLAATLLLRLAVSIARRLARARPTAQGSARPLRRPAVSQPSPLSILGSRVTRGPPGLSSAS